MEYASEIAEAVESSVDALVAVLERARLAQTPAIPPAQLRVLTIVAANQHTNMSRLCDRLEATGLLRRVADPRDRREVRLLLTAASRRLLADLRERRRTALAEILERMPAGSRQDLVRALQAFESAAADPPAATDDLRTA